MCSGDARLCDMETIDTLISARLPSVLYSVVIRRLTTGIYSEKCIVRQFRRCANVIECTYANLDSIAYMV